MSIDEYYIRLMNEEIDGVISDEDSEKLSRFIEEDPEAKRYYLELKDTVGAMEDSPSIDPPPELRRRIFDAVYGRAAGNGAPVIKPEKSFWRSWVPVFAAGVAAGIIIFAALRPLIRQTRGGDEYGATMGARESGPRVERFDAHGVRGSVVPVFEDGSLALMLSVASEEGASILLEFGEAGSFESISSSEGAVYQMEVDAESLLLVHSGESEYTIQLRSGGAGVDLSVFAGNRTVAAIRFAAEEK